MSRKSARENAFRLVYEYLETGERNDFTRELLCGRDVPADSEFTKRIYDTVLQNFAYIKSVIERYSKDFAFDRIYKTDLSALTVAVCELLYMPDVPEKVAVNEALELSRTYSTEKSTSFVNGVLASVIANKEELIHASEID
ncbi:MAG: transcription antitermination factor NusB [Clostridia bacterium]|jgi:N utilization substance protein B|nr:transcription antitermination factor NusB [Clostridia bacterium]